MQEPIRLPFKEPCYGAGSFRIDKTVHCIKYGLAVLKSMLTVFTGSEPNGKPESICVYRKQ
jgi:hypothetical protein